MDNDTRSFLQPLADTLGLSLQTCFLFLALGVLGLLAAAVLMRKQDRGYVLESGTAFVNQPRDKVIIVGPVAAGKTQLFYRLLSKVEPSTVSSTELNQTDGEVALEVPKRLLNEQPGLSLSVVDIPGHYNFRIKVQQYLERAKGVILVVDARDKDRVAEAAEFLYDMLSNNRLVRQRVPILVACNKQDLALAKRAVQIEREF